ncbi:hypothetical protein D3C81_1806140 [compost metagenome]
MLLQAARGSLGARHGTREALLERRHGINEEVGGGAGAHAQYGAFGNFLLHIVGGGLRHQRLEFILSHDNSQIALGETHSVAD